VHAIAKELGQTGFETDVSQEQSVNGAIEAAATAMGGIDGVVNAAGILQRTTVENTDFAFFQKIIGVNLAGPFLMYRATLPHLRKAPRATIVNIYSLAGLQGFPTMAVYSATKGGLIRFSEALCGEAGPTIRINCICPGVIRTAMTEYMFSGDDPFQPERRLQVGRAGEPLDVARAALYLSGDESSFVSGSTLTVMGGRLG
jgi:NAD(P)-dependent dehydrogenase (short-subunit alcohol dehydrogenase family)